MTGPSPGFDPGSGLDPSPGFRGFLVDGLGAMGIALDSTQLSHLCGFRRLLSEGGRSQNLTALEGDFEVAVKHFCDSLTCLRTGLFEGPRRLVDIGSGAGFPGVPLRVARPALDVTLLDSSTKRTAFLDGTIASLGLDGCRTAVARAENFGRQPEGRGRFDVAVARAVARLTVDLEYGVPLLAVGGHLVAMKGPRVDEELEDAAPAALALGAALIDRIDLNLPLSGEPRTLVVYRKTSETPDTYPRREGIPTKRPLGSPAKRPLGSPAKRP